MAIQVFNFEQGTPEWLEARRGVITGTRLKAVMGTKAARQWLIYELLGELISENIATEQYKSQAMDHGNNAEVVAKEKLGLDIKDVGFIKKLEWLWISPDGVIGEDGEYTEAVEIKSPEGKNFVRYCIEWGVPDEYKWQVVHYFIVIDTLQSVHFAIFNENIKDADCRMKSWKITRESMQSSIDQAKESLSAFKIEWETAKKQLIASFS